MQESRFRVIAANTSQWTSFLSTPHPLRSILEIRIHRSPVMHAPGAAVEFHDEVLNNPFRIDIAILAKRINDWFWSNDLLHRHQHASPHKRWCNASGQDAKEQGAAVDHN